jgi:hypothetical protein
MGQCRQRGSHPTLSWVKDTAHTSSGVFRWYVGLKAFTYSLCPSQVRWQPCESPKLCSREAGATRTGWTWTSRTMLLPPAGLLCSPRPAQGHRVCVSSTWLAPALSWSLHHAPQVLTGVQPAFIPVPWLSLMPFPAELTSSCTLTEEKYLCPCVCRLFRFLNSSSRMHRWFSWTCDPGWTGDLSSPRRVSGNWFKANEFASGIRVP